MPKKGNKFLWGIGLGALIGVLFAPRKGDDTRKKLTKAAEKAKSTLDKILLNVKERYEEAKVEVLPVVEDVKKKAKPYVDSLTEGLDGKTVNEDKPKKK